MTYQENSPVYAHPHENDNLKGAAETSSPRAEPFSTAELTSDVIYTADLKVCATVYIRASNIEEAQKVLATLSYTALYATGGNVGDSAFTDCFPDVEIAEAMTIHGQFDGDVLVPRYDLANQIDYG